MKEQYIVSQAPVRIDAGGPTDVSEFLQAGEKGFIFNAAIIPGAFVKLEPRTDSSIVISSEDFHLKETFRSFEELNTDGPLSLLKVAVMSVQPSRGFELSVKTGLLPGSGLGASAAVSVATLGALKTYKEGMNCVHDPALLAREAILLEERLGNTGGSQDQYAAAFGGFNAFSYSGEEFTREKIDISRSVQAQLESQLLIVYSGVSRFSGKILDSIIFEYKHGNPVIQKGLHSIRDLAIQIKETLQREDVEGFGNLLSEVWKAQKSLHSQITTPEIEDILKTAQLLGALGGKALGAGGGGCVLVLCAEEKKMETQNKLAEKYKIIDFRFSEKGIETKLLSA